MKKMLLYFLCIVLIFVISFTFLVFANDTDALNKEFLSTYGWKVNDNHIEKVELTLPQTEDIIYKNYNDLQKAAGLDLSPYYGKKVTRYTYIVLNYPYKTNQTIRANVLCYDNKPIAGDIMSVNSDGFMDSLIFPE